VVSGLAAVAPQETLSLQIRLYSLGFFLERGVFRWVSGDHTKGIVFRIDWCFFSEPGSAI
jgi:hypothetical protein